MSESVWVKCNACGAQFDTELKLPMELGKFARYMQAVECECGAGGDELEMAQEKTRDAITATDDIEKVYQWFGMGDTGISSKCLAFEFLINSGRTVSQTYDINAPYDPADLGRCLRLIAIVPAVRSAVDTLAKKNKRWAIAAAVWDEIASLMDKEVGIDWSKGRSAPVTYDMMKEAGL